MCYDSNSQPPVPPGTSQPAHGEDIVLKSADGASFLAYVAHTGRPTASQVIIYPDVRGLHQFYKELALRFAEVGVNALAIDYFGRTAGTAPRSDTFEFQPHVQQIKFDSFAQDVQAGLAYLRERFGAGVPTYVVGFCMGGSLSLITGGEKDMHLAGLVAFYAGMTRSFAGRGAVLENAGRIAFPVLGLFGGADQGIPESAVKELDAKLDTAGVPHTVVIYPGAPHSFFDRRATEYAEASSDAWKRVLAFVKSSAN